MEEAVKGPSSQELDNVESGVLRASHEEFLLDRHGTLDLVPLPSEFPEDPLNWPSWQKNINLFLVSFHAMMCLIMGAGIIPAYSGMAEEMGVSLQAATYFTSMQIAMLGGNLANSFVQVISAEFTWSNSCPFGVETDFNQNWHASYVVDRYVLRGHLQRGMCSQ
jgi:hypothetical protein